MCQEHLAHSENVNYFYYQRYEKKKRQPWAWFLRGTFEGKDYRTRLTVGELVRTPVTLRT